MNDSYDFLYESRDNLYGRGQEIEFAALQKKHANVSFGKVKIEGVGLSRDDAMRLGKLLRANGVFANIWHMEGPKSGPKSRYTVTGAM